MGLFGIALGLVVLAAAAVFGLQQYDTITISQRASETQMLLVQIAANMQAAYRTDPSYGTAGAVLTATAVDLSIIPSDYHTSATTAESPFAKPMRILAQGAEFEVAVDNLEEDECEALLSRPWRTGELRLIAIDGATGQSPDDITVAAVATACNTDDEDVVFRFR